MTSRPRYKLIKSLGQKSWLAVDKKANCLVRLQIYNCYSWAEYHQIEEFLELCDRLPRNLHLVRLKDCLLPKQKGSGIKICLVFSYVKGKTLAEVQLRSETELYQLARSLLRILIYFHRLIPVVCLHISPEFIILGDGGMHLYLDLYPACFLRDGLPADNVRAVVDILCGIIEENQIRVSPEFRKWFSLARQSLNADEALWGLEHFQQERMCNALVQSEAVNSKESNKAIVPYSLVLVIFGLVTWTSGVEFIAILLFLVAPGLLVVKSSSLTKTSEFNPKE